MRCVLDGIVTPIVDLFPKKILAPSLLLKPPIRKTLGSATRVAAPPSQPAIDNFVLITMVG